jgi:flavocytochrome c
MAGLSAALEAARDGARVLVVDMASVFGGHAVMSAADVTMIDTPIQRAKRIQDSPDLAYQDFINWGEDNNREWVRFYVDHSRSEIYDWLTALGVTFDGLRQYPGSRVPRAHTTKGLGLGLVGPVYRACLSNPNISFAWNTQVTDLIVDTGRVTGVRTKSTRTDETGAYRGRVVILATGGFQSNLTLVRQHWPKDTPVPERLLAGSGINSMGSGLELATKVGGTLSNLDHQWNYQRGLPDPRYPGAERGLNAGIEDSVWVNAQGKRFVDEEASSPVTLHALLQQQPATYWAVFDDTAKANLWVVGTGWNTTSIEHWILSNPELVKRADSIRELATRIGLPPDALASSVMRYNTMIEQGSDTDFGRFGKGSGTAANSHRPPKIEQPPFYAVEFFPLTRKSMGGVTVDQFSRVVDKENRPIAGLYAAGEAAGLAGINGKAALEGTFLGPSVLTGRVAGRSAAGQLKLSPMEIRRSTPTQPLTRVPTMSGPDCLGCHNLEALLVAQRPGYWHFERAHRLVLERKLECPECHSEMSTTFVPQQHTINRLMQSQICSTCH